MAKEQWHNWGRTLLVLAGIVFAGGGYAMKINGNSKATTVNAEAVVKVEDEIHDIVEDVHRIELNAKDIKNVAVQAAESMISIDSKLDAIQKEQANQATIQAVNSTKLESLTKD